MMPLDIRPATLADSVQCVFLPLQNFLEQSVPEIAAIAASVPAAVVSTFGFESRLDSDEAESDFLFTVNSGTGGREILAGHYGSGRISFDVADAGARRAIQGFGRKWADPAHILFAGADDIWFEFDVSSAGGKNRTPSFFFGPRLGPAPSEQPIRKTLQILQEGFAALLGAALPSNVREALERLLDSLPPHARIFQAGLMLSRCESPIRVCIDNLSAAELRNCVRNQLGAEGEKEVVAAMESLGPSAPSIKPSFDLGPQAANRVGLECYAAPPQLPWNPSRWQPLLQSLTQTGLCTAARRDLLLELPPYVYLDGSRPDDGDALLAALVGRAWAYALKLHHVKLTVQPGSATYAKSYVAVKKVWLW